MEDTYGRIEKLCQGLQGEVVLNILDKTVEFSTQGKNAEKVRKILEEAGEIFSESPSLVDDQIKFVFPHAGQESSKVEKPDL